MGKPKDLKYGEDAVYILREKDIEEAMLINNIHRIVVNETFRIQKGDVIIIELNSPKDGRYHVTEMLPFVGDNNIGLELEYIGHRIN